MGKRSAVVELFLGDMGSIQRELRPSILREDQLTMETKLEQIAVKAVNQLPKSVVREIRTPSSVGAGGGRPPPATRWRGEILVPTATIVRLPSAQVVRHWQWTPEIGRRLAVRGLWSPRNHLNREDGNESSALSSIRSVMPQSDQAARPDGPDRGQTKFR